MLWIYRTGEQKLYLERVRSEWSCFLFFTEWKLSWFGKLVKVFSSIFLFFMSLLRRVCILVRLVREKIMFEINIHALELSTFSKSLAFILFQRQYKLIHKKRWKDTFTYSTEFTLHRKVPIYTVKKSPLIWWTVFKQIQWGVMNI